MLLVEVFLVWAFAVCVMRTRGSSLSFSEEVCMLLSQAARGRSPFTARSTGFTLVELLVVIAIIGLLVAL